MFKIYCVVGGTALSTIKQCKDPFIIDVRKDSDDKLKYIYGRDYKHLSQLVNKGITQIILKSKTVGIMELNKRINKVKKFQRELVIISDSKEHLEYICKELNYDRRIIRI